MDEDDFVSGKRTDNPILLAPKRPTKKNDDTTEDPPSLFANSSRKEDSFGISSLDSPPKEKVECPLCMKDLSQLTSVRRSLHTNQCLDGQLTANNYRKAQEKHSLTIDCPICRKPLEPGPFRSAHIKRCGRESNIAPSKLVDLVETQTKIVEHNKKKGINHTSAPIPSVKAVKPPVLENVPKSREEEDYQLAKALSESMEEVHTKPPTPQFQRIDDLKKNRKKRPRSYSIVQLAPHECQCKVITLLHERFVTMFRTKKKKPIRDYVTECDDKVNFFALQERKLLDRLLHLDNLAKDLYSLSDQSNKTFDFTLKCKDGEVKCHRLILEKRTRGIANSKDNVHEFNESCEIVKSWLSYVCSGAIEWSEDDNEPMRRLGLKYGPDGIIIACKRIEKQDDDNEREKSFLRRVKSTSHITDEKSILGTKTVYSQYDEPKDVYEEQDDDGHHIDGGLLHFLESSNLNDDPIVQEISVQNVSLDCEDPLQGIQMNNSTISIASEITIIDEVSKRSPTIRINENTEEEESPELMSTEEILQEPAIPEEVDLSSSPLVCEEPAPIPDTSNEYYEPNYDFPIDDWNEMDNNANEDIFKESYWKTDAVNEKEKTPDLVLQPLPVNNEIHPSPRRRSSRLTQIRKSLESKEDTDSFDSPHMYEDLRLEPLDSFDDMNAEERPKSNGLPMASPSTSFTMPLAQSTPLQPSPKRPKFGSNVKILKTTEITPMPNYEGMDDNELKAELARHGMRPMGRKRAVEQLLRIYDSVHPVIDPTTPTIRPLLRLDDDAAANQPVRKSKPIVERPKPAKRHMLFEELTPTKAAPELIPSSPTSSDDGLGNQTLNEPQDEPMEESMIESALPKDIKSMTASLLNWLKKPENEELYCHILSLQPVMIDELHVRLTRSEDPASLIPKKSLGAILDRMGVTFSLPQPTGGRRGMGAIKRRK